MAVATKKKLLFDNAAVALQTMSGQSKKNAPNQKLLLYELYDSGLLYW